MPPMSLEAFEKRLVDGRLTWEDALKAVKLGIIPASKYTWYVDAIASVAACRPFPPIEKHYSGTALVCGSAWTLMDDLFYAREIRPDATVFAINRAGGLIGGDFLVSKDLQQAKEWRAAREAFDDKPFLYLAPRPFIRSRKDFPEVDHWQPAANSGGTTAWAATRAALFLGHDEVILCGVPLVPGEHADGQMGATWAGGSESKQQIETHRAAMQRDRDLKKFVRSMSGWTKGWFGAPESERQAQADGRERAAEAESAAVEAGPHP